MKRTFKKIGVMGRVRNAEIVDTLKELKNYLLQQNYDVIVDENTAVILENDAQMHTVSNEEFGKECDLAIVVGGDGSILNAAKFVVDDHIPVLGINRGRLGFLADIHPTALIEEVDSVLKGDYLEETRFLLEAQVTDNKHKILYQNLALNDVVVLPGEFSHLIEFNIYIDKQFVCNQRADGQIISTPTGSTAYALSGGGPILHPQLNAIVLVPMFPHTLTSRPLVIDGNCEIEIEIAKNWETSPLMSCDGQERIAIAPGNKLSVRKYKNQLILLHSKTYNYFATLRDKLHWQTKL